MKDSFFDLLFLVNLSVFPWDFCVFLKDTMYDYLYCENGGLEWFPVWDSFQTLVFNTKNVHFLCS